MRLFSEKSSVCSLSFALIVNQREGLINDKRSRYLLGYNGVYRKMRFHYVKYISKSNIISDCYLLSSL